MVDMMRGKQLELRQEGEVKHKIVSQMLAFQIVGVRRNERCADVLHLAIGHFVWRHAVPQMVVPHPHEQLFPGVDVLEIVQKLHAKSCLIWWCVFLRKRPHGRHLLVHEIHPGGVAVFIVAVREVFEAGGLACSQWHE
jgi:hypothetical protein